jgi:hypothetical protein
MKPYGCSSQVKTKCSLLLPLLHAIHTSTVHYSPYLEQYASHPGIKLMRGSEVKVSVGRPSLDTRVWRMEFTTTTRALQHSTSDQSTRMIK